MSSPARYSSLILNFRPIAARYICVYHQSYTFTQPAVQKSDKLIVYLEESVLGVVPKQSSAVSGLWMLTVAST